MRITMKAKIFKPRTKAEKELVLLIKNIFEQISGDGFNEWHAWSHDPSRDNEPCPNSSPFIPFLKEWIKKDKKLRLPIVLSGYQAHARDVWGDSSLTVETRRRKP